MGVDRVRATVATILLLLVVASATFASTLDGVERAEHIGLAQAAVQASERQVDDPERT
jgi:hypothetical protein